MIKLILIFIAGAVVGGVITWFAARKKHPYILKDVGMLEKQAKEKEENLAKVMEYFGRRGRVANNDVQKLLNISDATATRYLDELEKEGKIRQVGKTGVSTYYETI